MQRLRKHETYHILSAFTKLSQRSLKVLINSIKHITGVVQGYLKAVVMHLQQGSVERQATTTACKYAEISIR